MVQIDTSTEFGTRVARRLQEEEVIWLVTTRPDGTPEPSPVWFLQDGDSLLIYSQPNKVKLRNIERQPRVALNFNTNATGDDVVIFTGEARIAPNEPPVDQNPAYIEKYAEPIRRLGMDNADFAREYSVPIRVALKKLRGF